jgi:hypothetical protein
MSISAILVRRVSEERKTVMKFMVQMNVGGGGYRMEGWAPDDIKRMVNYMHDLNRELKAAGQFVVAEGLAPPDQARLVTAKPDGGLSVTDGPFAESKEFIAGFWIINAKDADEAYKFAARVSSCPGPGGKPLNFPVEVRQVGEAPKTE